MRLTIATVLSEGVCAEVRLVHLDDRATPVEYPAWRRVTVTAGEPVTLDVPDLVVLTASADLAASNPIAVRPGGIYRAGRTDGQLTLSLHAVHQLALRREAGLLNDTDHDVHLTFSIGGATAWRAGVAAAGYGIFDLAIAVELTFLDAAGNAVSRSVYATPDGVTHATLCCRRVPSTGRIYADPAPPAAPVATARRGSPSRVTFRVRAHDVGDDARLAVFLVPRDAPRLALLPWRTFDLSAPQKFWLERDARTISAVLHDGRRVAPRTLLPGQVQALVESPAGEPSLVVDGEAWLDAIASRLDNHLPQPVEVRLGNAGHVYAVADLDAADGDVPSSALFDSAPPTLAFLIAHGPLPRDRFRAADLGASAHVAPMPAPGAELVVVVEGHRVRVTA